MIAYRDFVPHQLTNAGLFRAPTYETLDAAVTAANDWIAASRIDVINVETVVMPNLASSPSKGPDDPNRLVSPSFVASWTEFVRVWFRQS